MTYETSYDRATHNSTPVHRCPTKPQRLCSCSPGQHPPWTQSTWLEMSVSCRFLGGPNQHDTLTCCRQCWRHKKSSRRHSRANVATCRLCDVVSFRTNPDMFATCRRKTPNSSTTIRKIHNRQHNHPHHGERPPPPAARI